MNFTASQDLITNALAVFGASVLAILTAVLSVGVAYLVFKWGWSQVRNSLAGVSYGEWKDIKDPEFFGAKYRGGKMRMRRKYEDGDSFDEYEFNGKNVAPW